MNEGWAAIWESRMMTDEAFAGDDEFISYADHMAQVLGSPGLNPYKLGMELWEYVENYTNRREVIERLLKVEGVTWRNFHDTVDLDEVQALLEPDPEMRLKWADFIEIYCPLSEEEQRYLEYSILAEGVRDPLVLWERKPGEYVLVDGHNRYGIVQKFGDKLPKRAFSPAASSA